MWGSGLTGNNAACSTLCWLSSTTHFLPYPQSNWALLVLIPRVGGFVYVLGPCRSLQRTLLWGWEFLLPLQPPQVFSVTGLRLYFLTLGPWVSWSVSLPSYSSLFIHRQLWELLLHQLAPHLLYQPLPCLAVSPLHPSCPSPPLLSIWMNVSFLNPWLSDFYTVQFSVSSGCLFVFKLVVVLLLVEEAQCIYLWLHLGHVLFMFLILAHS